MIIDAHAHVVPEGYPSRDGFPLMQPVDGEHGSDARLRQCGPGSVRDVFFRTEQRIAAMDARGRREIVSPMPPLLNYALEPTLGLDLARHINRDDRLPYPRRRWAYPRTRHRPTSRTSMRLPSTSRPPCAKFGRRRGRRPAHASRCADRRWRAFSAVLPKSGRLRLSVFVYTCRRARIGVAAPGCCASWIASERAAAPPPDPRRTARRCALERAVQSPRPAGLPRRHARARRPLLHQQPAEIGAVPMRPAPWRTLLLRLHVSTRVRARRRPPRRRSLLCSGRTSLRWIAVGGWPTCSMKSGSRPGDGAHRFGERSRLPEASLMRRPDEEKMMATMAAELRPRRTSASAAAGRVLSLLGAFSRGGGAST